VAESSTNGRGGFSLLATWLLAIAALAWLTTLSVWTLEGSIVIGMFSDSVWYLAVADYYRSLVGAQTLLDAQAAYDTSRFPPIYPALIAAVGGGIESQASVHHLTVALNAAAVFATAWWAAQLTRSVPVALAALPLIILTPAFLNWLFVPMSEPLFLVGVVASLVAAHRARSGAIDILSVAAVVSIVPLIRSAGIALVAAFAVWALFAAGVRPWKRATAILIAAVPGAAWAIYRSTKPVFLSYGDDVSLSRMIAEGETLTGYVRTQVLAMVDGVHSWFGLASPTVSGVFIVVLGLLALHGWWRRIKTLELDAIFVPIYLGMLLLWPYPSEMTRLLSVVLPLIAVWALVGLTRWFPVKEPSTVISRAAVLAGAIAGIAVAVPSWIVAVDRATTPVAESLEPYKRTVAYFQAADGDGARVGLETTVRIIGLIDEATHVVEAGACIYSTYPSLVLAVSRGRLRGRLTPQLTPGQPIQEQLPECRYLLVVNLGTRPAYAVPLYPAELIQDSMNPLLVSEQYIGDARFVAAALLEK
jgi:hypothetical protein